MEEMPDELTYYSEGGDNHILDTLVPWRKSEDERVERFQIWLGSRDGQATMNKLLLESCKPKLIYADFPQHSVAPPNRTQEPEKGVEG